MEFKPDLFKYFNSTTAQLDVLTFASDLILAAILAFILSRFYEKFGCVLSNRKAFASNFVAYTKKVKI